jgi:hypothetical protein
MRSITLRIGLAACSMLFVFANIGNAQQYSNQMRATGNGSSPAMITPTRRAIDTGRNMAPAVQRVPSVVNQGRVAPTKFVPSHTRRQQENSIVTPAPQGSPAQPAVEPVPMTQSPQIVGGAPTGSCAGCGTGGIGRSYFEDGGMMGGCDSCDSCGTMDCGACDSCCDRGGCPDGLADCWLGKIGLLLNRGEYFSGAQGFKAPAFSTDNGNQLAQDSSFGFNAGANFGVPLCKLTCGLMSGQIGVRAVSSDHSGAPFTSDNRQQLFVTAGFFRRVDNGLQFGCVADFLEERWFVDSSLVQIRGDLAWVFYGDNAMGFRFTQNVQDDVSTGRFNGQPVTNLITSSQDNYRAYYRQSGINNGYADLYLGWSENKHFVGGIDFDLPLTERLALQSSVTYFYPQDDRELLANGGNANEAWNIGVGMVFRPQGRCYYQNYDRPILPVADNGTMVLDRSRFQ